MPIRVTSDGEMTYRKTAPVRRNMNTQPTTQPTIEGQLYQMLVETCRVGEKDAGGDENIDYVCVNPADPEVQECRRKSCVEEASAIARDIARVFRKEIGSHKNDKLINCGEWSTMFASAVRDATKTKFSEHKGCFRAREVQNKNSDNWWYNFSWITPFGLHAGMVIFAPHTSAMNGESAAVMVDNLYKIRKGHSTFGAFSHYDIPGATVNFKEKT